MKGPDFQEEKKLWRRGYKYVVCLDEVGRGCLAGPVVACAVMIINPKHEARNPKQIPMLQIRNSKRFGKLKNWNLDIVSNFDIRISNLKIRDSKKLSPKARDMFYKILISHPDIKWGTGRVYPRVIDRINIFEATKLAMARAIQNLAQKYQLQKTNDRSQIVGNGFFILDGNMKLNLPIPQKAIVKADEKVFSCAAASIIAKVSRDRLMRKYHKKYPEYGFDKHKGYGTKRHLVALRKFGPCELHRKSFCLAFSKAGF
ncbi:MAG: ribonuclease HII [Parcubacteria group bacterium Gr01-1014_30]|nr:MAG: ribonuclease HII [Parcubacteria group bacterium Gr01-1014_30]